MENKEAQEGTSAPSEEPVVPPKFWGGEPWQQPTGAVPQDDSMSGAHFNAPVFQPPSKTKTPRLYALHPFTVADILDMTFSLMKTHWKKFGIASLIYALPAGLLSALSTSVASDGDQRFIGGASAVNEVTNFGSNASSLSGSDLLISAICSLLLIGVSLVLSPMVQGTLTRLVGATFVGREMSVKEAFNGVKGMWLTFIGASILVVLATIGGLIGLLVGAIAVAVLFTVVIPVIAIEEEGVFNAMGRSWALMKRRFWGYLGIRALLVIINFFVSYGVLLIPGVLASIFYGLGADPIAVVFGAFGLVLSEVVVFPIAAVAATLIYFDARVRFEGFDVQLMAARLPQGLSTQQNPADNGPGRI